VQERDVAWLLTFAEVGFYHTLENIEAIPGSKEGVTIMVVSESAFGRPGAAEAPTRDTRTGGATVWAAIAVVWLAIAVQAVVRWLFSADFGPSPLIGPDHMPTWNLVALRVFEVLSIALLLGLVWFCVVVPWRRTGRLSLDGKFVLGGWRPLWPMRS
jgi:hypothetical protein